MDKYEIIRMIGEGAFGKAFLAKQKSDHAQCVIKEVNLSKMPLQEKIASHKEVTLLSKMKHPNIVTFFTAFEEINYLYIVMEYCDGGNLMNKINLNRLRRVLFEEDQILSWFVQISLGLKHIHDRKVLHRDIKAENIFLSRNGTVAKLGDFGLARLLNYSMELVRTQAGTPVYQSPEIWQNQRYNNKTDIWSLGCVLYELCALKHPFDAPEIPQLKSKICRGFFEPISAKYSYDLRGLISQLLKISSWDRPSINSILKKPFLEKMIKRCLSLEEEFSHMALHKQKELPPKHPRSTPTPRQPAADDPRTNRKPWRQNAPGTMWKDDVCDGNLEQRTPAKNEVDETDTTSEVEEQLEPSSDDYDTNFEESEDELGESVMESMEKFMKHREDDSSVKQKNVDKNVDEEGTGKANDLHTEEPALNNNNVSSGHIPPSATNV
ncbi:serine/threonine-protein kinase Nek5-like isoform X2 [Pelobates fuscus]